MRERFVHAPGCAALDTVYTFDRKRGVPAKCTCRGQQKTRRKARGDCEPMGNGNRVTRPVRSPSG